MLHPMGYDLHMVVINGLKPDLHEYTGKIALIQVT